MKIRPKIPLLLGGNTISPVDTDPNSTWFTRSGNSILERTFKNLESLYRKYLTSKNVEDYNNFAKEVERLNGLLRFSYAPLHQLYENNKRKNIGLKENPAVGSHLSLINTDDNKYINEEIGGNFLKYKVISKNPTSGDNPSEGWKVDNLNSGITNDRTPWGYLSNSNDKDYINWKDRFKSIGIDFRTDGSGSDVLYGFIEPFNNIPKVSIDIPKPNNSNSEITDDKPSKIEESTSNNPTTKIHAFESLYLNKFDWNKIINPLSKAINSPELFSMGRLAGNLINNDRVYKESLKAIKPTLLNSYKTQSQVFGDEGLKLSYYYRAVKGETKASRPITSDLDKQVAYQMEAKKVGDEYRALGDLIDNAEIKRTSELSNQHQWDNIRRSNEVANTNRAAMDKAEALRHNLLAQKHSAQWSSLDNYLLEKESRIRLKDAENKALDELIFLLQLQLNLLNNPKIEEARKKYLEVRKRHTDADGNVDETNEEVRRAAREYNQALINSKIELYRAKLKHLYNGISEFSTGAKIVYKKKDDLLYKTTKDIVEHFRKMSKMSSDALDRKQPKVEKLSPHPKGKTKKYLLGGLAPFTVYRPAAVGGETTTSSQTSTTSTKSGKGSDVSSDLMKKLFENLSLEGLPSDVNGVYSSIRNLLEKLSVFGDSLTFDDVATAYVLQMLRINNIKFNKALFDKVQTIVNNKDAGSEFAIDLYGRLAVQNRETNNIEYRTWKEVKENSDKYNPLRNNDILNLRAYSVDLAFNSNLILTASNATSMTEIAKFLNELVSKIEKNELEHFSKKDSNIIRQGIAVLKEAHDGIYKIKDTSNKQLAIEALKYIESILPKNMRTLLQVNAEINGTTTESLLTSLISSRIGESTEISSTKSENGDETGKLSPSIAFFMGMGDRKSFVILDKTNDGLKIDTNSMSLLDSSGHNLGPATLLEIKLGQYGSQLDINSATMGGVKISVNGQNDVLVSDGMIYSTELPIDEEAAKNKIYKPNLSFLKNIEKADEKLREMGITNRDNLTQDKINTINKVYKDNDLPIIYTLDSKGEPVLTPSYRRFAILNGYATKDAFEEELNFNDGVIQLSSKEGDLFEQMMKNVTKNDKFKINSEYWGFGDPEAYKGTVYIPMNPSTITALGGTGYKGSAEEYMYIDKELLKRDNALRLGYTNGGNASKLK